MLRYIIPFVILIIGLLLPDFGINTYLAYSIKTFAALIAIAYYWKHYKEIKIRFDYKAWLFGFIIIAVWLGLEFLNDGSASEFNPFNFTGYMTYLVISVKMIGMIIVAPVVEELFVRSFLIRLLIRSNFEKVKIGKFTWFSFMITVLFFGFMHGSTITGSRLVAGLVSGIMFNLWLYYSKDIFSCIQCHAAANLGLAIVAIATQNWILW